MPRLPLYKPGILDSCGVYLYPSSNAAIESDRN